MEESEGAPDSPPRPTPNIELPTDSQFEELAVVSETESEYEDAEDDSGHSKYTSKRVKSLFKSVPRWGEMVQNGEEKLKQKVAAAWNNVKDAASVGMNALQYNSLWANDDSEEYEKMSVIVMLSKFYSMSGGKADAEAAHRQFSSDYYSRIWLTYRTGFPPLLSSSSTSDCGWGCTLRTGQMMIAQALSTIHLSRDWRFEDVSKKAKEKNEQGDATSNTHKEIVALFNDKEDAPMGLHSLLAESREKEGAIGKWFSPSEALHLLRRCVSQSSSPLTVGLEVVVSVDMLVDVCEMDERTCNWSRSLVLVVCLRLGLTTVNEFYYKHIKHLLQHKTCLGLVGGQPNRSLYIVGYNDNDVIFLDPHVAHSFNDSLADLSSFHCRLLSKMPLSSMDPSCAVGFLFSSREEFMETFRHLNRHAVVDMEEGEDGSRRNEFPLFTVVTQPMGDIPHKKVTKEEAAEANEEGFDLV